MAAKIWAIILSQSRKCKCIFKLERCSNVTLNIAYFYVTIVQITALKSPSEFYRTLLDRCRTAKHRIVIASLYLGIGNLEQELVSKICMDCYCVIIIIFY